jgi:prolipoprotein diacylglyceryltransferase
LASIPSPARAAWRLGPLSIRAYALCVTLGIIVAVIVASRRYRRSGGRPAIMLDVAAWAVPFGLAGAAVHAVLIDTRHDFMRHAHLWHALADGVAAIGVPGAVTLGAAGAWIACRRARLPLGPVAGAAAPAVLFGLAIGELGNWWTQQFYGRPSTWWWAVQISPIHRVPGYENYSTFQPAFAYQSLWDVAAGFAVIWASRSAGFPFRGDPSPRTPLGRGDPPGTPRRAGFPSRRDPSPRTPLGRGEPQSPRGTPRRPLLTGERTFMLGAAAYAVGGFWVESVRIGPLPQVLGIRYGAAGDVVVFALAVVGLYLTRPRRTPPARTYPKAALVDDSSGDVMSM